MMRAADSIIGHAGAHVVCQYVCCCVLQWCIGPYHASSARQGTSHTCRHTRLQLETLKLIPTTTGNHYLRPYTCLWDPERPPLQQGTWPVHDAGSQSLGVNPVSTWASQGRLRATEQSHTGTKNTGSISRTVVPSSQLWSSWEHTLERLNHWMFICHTIRGRGNEPRSAHAS